MERRWKESGIPGLYEGSGPEMRERARNIRALLYPKPKLASGPIERFTIPGPAGDIGARVVWPLEGRPTGTLVYFHGGGWIVGDLDSHEAHAIRLANSAGVVVVNVGYRLAPEHPFPAGVDDAIAATRWVHAHIDRFGGDSAHIAVGGDSAGGNLAAVVAVQCRDEGLALAAQLLLYPATDLTRMGDPAVSGAYLGEQVVQKARDPRVSPALTPTLAGLAPAIIGVGHHDFLYRDNLAYAEALKQAGVPVTLREYPMLNHGFFSYTAISPASEAAAEALCADLRRVLQG
jgi:acetyl esterase/lipase